MDDDGTTIMQAKPVTSNGDSDIDNDNDTDDDDIVEVIQVKSQTALNNERHSRALTAGAVCSLKNNTTIEGPSMRSTFESISSSVTAMRNARYKRYCERQGVTLKDESPLIQYQATRMLLDDEREKVIVKPGEKPNGRKVRISLYPFAQGGLRNVYRMKQDIPHLPHSHCLVAKESRHNIPDHERLRFHVETSKCQARAADYVRKFNKKLKKCPSLKPQDVPRIEMLRTAVYRVKDPSYPRGYRYLMVEVEMKGAQYCKWNNNNGYVNSSDSLHCIIAQAFSHFTYESSEQMEMVVDIQGSADTKLRCTDPQLHSVEKKYGRADRGNSGFKDFFKTHKCSFVCKRLKLINRSMMNTDVCTSVKQDQN